MTVKVQRFKKKENNREYIKDCARVFFYDLVVNGKIEYNSIAYPVVY